MIAALISTFSAINATLYGSSRINYELAEDDELPHEFTVVIKNEPIGLIITAILSLVIGNLVPLVSISGMGSIGFLFIFLMINLGAYLKRKEIGGISWVYLLGFFLTIFALVVLIINQVQTSLMTVIYTTLLMLFCFVFEYIFKKYGHLPRKEKMIKRVHKEQIHRNMKTTRLEDLK